MHSSHTRSLRRDHHWIKSQKCALSARHHRSLCLSTILMICLPLTTKAALRTPPTQSRIVRVFSGHKVSSSQESSLRGSSFTKRQAEGRRNERNPGETRALSLNSGQLCRPTDCGCESSIAGFLSEVAVTPTSIQAASLSSGPEAHSRKFCSLWNSSARKLT